MLEEPQEAYVSVEEAVHLAAALEGNADVATADDVVFARDEVRAGMVAIL